MLNQLVDFRHAIMKTVKTLLLIGATLMVADFVSAQTWTQTIAPMAIWWSVASSADGNKLAAVSWETDNGSEPGLIFTSTNSGACWSQTIAPTNYWVSIASSADGTKLVAAASDANNDGLIYTSTDSGTTWTSNCAPNFDWVSAASSADGNILVVVGDFNTLPLTLSSYQGVVYTSTNSGMNWVSNNLPVNVGYWRSVASSADGLKMVVVSPSDAICTSTNAGATWQQADNAPSNIWVSV